MREAKIYRWVIALIVFATTCSVTIAFGDALRYERHAAYEQELAGYCKQARDVATRRLEEIRRYVCAADVAPAIAARVNADFAAEVLEIHLYEPWLRRCATTPLPPAPSEFLQLKPYLELVVEHVSGRVPTVAREEDLP